MSYLYQLHEHAQEDYEDSVIWYMERSTKAAENLVDAVDNALVLICNNPTRWHNKYKNYYELGLKKYPFKIIYTIDEVNELVTVTSIYHQKRNPRKKYNRKK
jgi:plasmid stabilization system protein ParE